VLVRGSSVVWEIDAGTEVGVGCNNVRMAEVEDGGGCVDVVARECI
jgi:hypothetical protein